MIRNKHLRLDQSKIERAKKILGVHTETEAIHIALDRVAIQRAEVEFKTKKLRQMLRLRTEIGKVQETTADWIRMARREREPHGRR